MREMRTGRRSLPASHDGRSGILRFTSSSMASVYSARCMGVSTYPGATAHTLTLGRQFERHGLSQFDHSSFGRVVVRVEGLADDSVGRSSLQNHAAVALPHVAGRDLSHVEDACQIYRDDFVPFRRE